ncbi:MAG TPA: M48 family metallopeptidase [Flavisolibacter sp.]|nr:M48 family metallopeptidase [Flavisolibacter sp.]
MLRIFSFLLLIACFESCNEVDRVIGREKSKKTTYSYACLDSAVGRGAAGARLEQAGDFLRDLAVSEKSITDSVQTNYGLAFHQQMIRDGSFKLWNDATVNKKLALVLNNLLSERVAPSTIRYKIYALADTVVNAFTFGGHIYITRAMLKKCAASDALLYAIIGHEIGHSERGHIKATIQELELSNKWFGEKGGATYFGIKKLLTASMNQRNELEADYYGIELTNALGYDVCTAVGFWKEMASNENRYSQVEDFFRSHPFSSLRSECLRNHIGSNFGKECGVVNEAASIPQVVD